MFFNNIILKNTPQDNNQTFDLQNNHEMLQIGRIRFGEEKALRMSTPCNPVKPMPLGAN